jgi:hypothetical protein
VFVVVESCHCGDVKERRAATGIAESRASASAGGLFGFDTHRIISQNSHRAAGWPCLL